MAMPLQAQHLVPLTGNPQLLQAQPDLPKGYAQAAASRQRACQLEEDNVNYILAGDPALLTFEIDTFGLDTLPGTFNCTNCEGNRIGEASLQNDTLVLIAGSELQAARDTFRIEFCNPNGCKSTSLIVVGRRASQSTAVGPIAVAAEGMAEVPLQAANLPGPLACNRFIDQPDDYEGRDQLAYFSNYQAPDSVLIYVASRYPGQDVITVTLCDSFAICDDFNITFQINKAPLALGDGGLGAFLDDFSQEGHVTNSDLWLDRDPFINRTFANDNPTLGVATFDGIKPDGTPYGASGLNDRLTSNNLDLTGLDGDLFLTFWLKPRGLGESPENGDFFQLEFKNQAGNWEVVRTFFKEEFDIDTTAAGFFFPMEVPGGFKHEAFQFRFSAFNSGNGIDDIWNLDYVWLGDDPAIATTNITDVALRQVPAAAIAPYTSMPWRHFRGQEEALLPSNYLTYLFNLNNDQALNAGAGDLVIRELTTGVQLAATTLLDACCRTVEANSPATYDQNYPNFPGLVQAFMNTAFNFEDRLEFETSYQLSDVTNEQGGSGYSSVTRNNNASRLTVFDDYFAYDDGTAETGVVVQERDQIAVRYTAAVDDTLQALQFHFPSMINDFSNQEFHLQVWVGALDDEPEVRMTFQNPFFPASVYDTLQAFTTYPLMDSEGNPSPIFIPAGDFYVGWEQVSSCNFLDCIVVGYDRNTPAGLDALFYNNNDQGWLPFPANFPAGALMLRPLMGNEPALPTSAEAQAAAAFEVQAYPNPAGDVLQIETKRIATAHLQLELINALGQTVHRAPYTPQLDVSGLVPGMYLVRATDNLSGQSAQLKIMIARAIAK